MGRAVRPRTGNKGFELLGTDIGSPVRFLFTVVLLRGIAPLFCQILEVRRDEVVPGAEKLSGSPRPPTKLKTSNMPGCDYCSEAADCSCMEEVQLKRGQACKNCSGFRARGERNCRNCIATRLSSINFDRNARWTAELAEEAAEQAAKKAAKAVKVAEQQAARKERERVRREKAKASSAKRDASPKRGEPGENFFDRLVELQAANGPAVEEVPTQTYTPELSSLEPGQLIEFAVPTE